MIGHLSEERTARTFGDFLYVRGIPNQVEQEEGRWAVWVHNEDEIPAARSLLEEYQRNPSASEFAVAGEKARRQRKQEATEEKAASKRFFDSEEVFNKGRIWGMSLVTFALVGISVLLWLLSMSPKAAEWLHRYFLISHYLIDTPAARFVRGLQEIREGQVWRLITPIFLHFNFLHLLFNMLCLRDLGTAIETKRGPKYLLWQVLVIGAISNLGQYYLSGPLFFGMSGVVYGLLGFVWMKGKFDPFSGFFLHPTTVVMMLIWLCIGFLGTFRVGDQTIAFANGAHTFGLMAGMAWGYISAVRRS